MRRALSRREMVGAAGAAAMAGTVAGAVRAAPQGPAPGKTIKIVAVCASPRKGKTTTAGLRICLEAAKAVDPEHIETELIELAGLKIDGNLAAGIPLEPGQKDDFDSLVPRLSDPTVAGIILGTPVYFGNMSSLCKAFLDRCIVFRKNFGLSNKVGGVLAVGGARNGGQEQTLRSVQAALFGQEMILVGDGRPTSHCGATLWNNGKDDIGQEEPGIATAKNLGRRVAEVARRLAGA